MMKPCILIVGCLTFFSCNNNKGSDPETTTDSGSPVQCYSYTNAKDTIQLKLIPIGETVTGTLVYMLDGKDKNTGTIQGVMRDDLLIAEYTFMSEGTRSVRQVAFLKKDSFYIEGYGEVEDRENRMQFRDTDSLWYNDSIRLTPTSCQD